MDRFKANELVRQRFVYRAEKGDPWRVLNTRGSGPLKGDCEDYSLTVLWLVCDRSLGRFLGMFLDGTARMWFCISPNRERHHVLQLGRSDDFYLDNLRKDWGSRSDYTHAGYKFKHAHSPLVAMVRLFCGLLA